MGTCPIMESAINFSKDVIKRTQNFTGRKWIFKAVDEWLSSDLGIVYPYK